MFKFEQLEVWHEAAALTARVNSFRLDFPSTETYVLGTQIQRAADSVALNISEGSTLQSDKEFVRFLVMANRSAIEVCACLKLAQIRGLGDAASTSDLLVAYEKLIIRVQALIKRVKARMP
jgi:four helix bundle protein